VAVSSIGDVLFGTGNGSDVTFRDVVVERQENASEMHFVEFARFGEFEQGCYSSEENFCSDLLQTLQNGLHLVMDGTEEEVLVDPYVPKEAWKQVVIFIVGFVGIAFGLEVLLYYFMSQSLTTVLWLQESRGEVLSAVRTTVTSSVVTPEEEPLLTRTRSENGEPLLHPSKTSLNASPNIPLHAKVILPIFVVGTILIFIVGNKFVGASVEIILDYEHKKWWPWSRHDKNWEHQLFGPYFLFEFSLVNTITEMWRGGVYMLALLVLVWSGIWPYLKLCLLLVCWYVPNRVLTTTTRGRLLEALDNLGKWCLIDLFLMLLMTVAFRFHIDTTDVPVTKWFHHDAVILEVVVSSRSGLFAYVFGAVLSILLGHIVSQYHKTATAADVSDFLMYEFRRNSDAEDEVDDSSKEGPKFCFPCPRRSWFNVGSEELPMEHRNLLNQKISIADFMFSEFSTVASRLWKVTVMLLVLVTLILIIYGGIVESFEFTFTDLAGKAIGVVQPESRVRRYSLLDVAMALDPGPKSLERPELSGIVFLQFVYLAFAYALPICLCIFLGALFLIPMRLRDQKIVHMCTSLISSFAALDCFIVSIIASLVEINQFAKFLVGDHCDTIEKYLKEPCFGIQTRFLDGCWIIVAAATLLVLINQLIFNAASRVIHDREFAPVTITNSQGLPE